MDFCCKAAKQSRKDKIMNYKSRETTDITNVRKNVYNI